jgi:hypothetical protein
MDSQDALRQDKALSGKGLQELKTPAQVPFDADGQQEEH